MNNPLISIILPIYNVENYLHKSIDSVINQTYKNIEIILVDDGSTDNSSKICDEYVSLDPRIKVIHKKNGGLSSARNIGIDNAKGEFIALIDSDDFISINFINELLNLIIKYNVDIAECDIEKVNEIDSKLFQFSDNSTLTNPIILNNYEALTRIHNDDFSICLRSVIASNKLYRKSLFNNIKYPLNKVHEDEFTTYRLFYKSRKVAFSNKKMYAYLQRQNSIMHTKFSIKRLDALEAYDSYLNFFFEQNLYEMQARTCRRYLRLLSIIKTQVKNSDFENKNIIFDILENKFRYICNFIDDLVSEHPELSYRKTLCAEFIKKYNEV